MDHTCSRLVSGLCTAFTITMAFSFLCLPVLHCEDAYPYLSKQRVRTGAIFVDYTRTPIAYPTETVKSYRLEQETDIDKLPIDAEFVVYAIPYRKHLTRLKEYVKLRYLHVEYSAESDVFSADSSRMIADIPNLKALRFGLARNTKVLENDLTAGEFPCIGSFRNLEELSIEDTHCDATLPAAIGALPSLRALSMCYVRWSIEDSEVARAFPKSSKVQRLRFGRVSGGSSTVGLKGVTSELGLAVSNLPELVELEIWGRVEQNGLRAICLSKTLKHLIMTGIRMHSEEELSSLGKLASLTSLEWDAADYENRDLIPKAIEGRDTIEQVYVHSSPDSGRRMTHAGISCIVTLPSLKVLYCQDAVSIDDIQSGMLSKLSAVQSMVLAVDGITDELLLDISKCTSLERLALRLGPEASDKGLKSIGSLEQLRVVTLVYQEEEGWIGKPQNFQITEEGLIATLARLTKLKGLFLSCFTPILNPKVYEQIASLKTLTHLSIAYGSPSSEDLKRLEALPMLEYLGMQTPKISDGYADTIGKMKQLKTLALYLYDETGEQLVKSLGEVRPELEVLVYPW